MLQATKAGYIGPNAIIQVARAVNSLEGSSRTRCVFAHAGIERYLVQPPLEMVRETEVAALQQSLREILGLDRARAVNLAAGRFTAEYLLANRIPRPAQIVLRWLPAAIASRFLSTAIGRNAWTFAGSGTFACRPGRPTAFEISNCPLCRDTVTDTNVCDFYSGTFEGLFTRLVHPRARATEIECHATGGAACRFQLSW